MGQPPSAAASIVATTSTRNLRVLTWLSPATRPSTSRIPSGRRKPKITSRLPQRRIAETFSHSRCRSHSEA